MRKLKIGFIGQGFVGKAYADDFEDRGFVVTRYSLEEKHKENKEEIKNCDIVFVMVPTPTRSGKFDFSIVKSALRLVGEGKTAVIKSTILPGTTNKLQKKFPKLFVLHSPEFLIEAKARECVRNPERNIIGIAKNNNLYRQKANDILKVLRPAPFNKIMGAKEAELVKYAGNCFLYIKVVYSNLLFDLSKSLGIDFEIVREAYSADSRIGRSHTNPVGKDGRGAGGHCFIKDFSAFTNLYTATKDIKGSAVLRAMANKNNDLLKQSKKDLKILEGVYGKFL